MCIIGILVKMHISEQYVITSNINDTFAEKYSSFTLHLFLFSYSLPHSLIPKIHCNEQTMQNTAQIATMQVTVPEKRSNNWKIQSSQDSPSFVWSYSSDTDVGNSLVRLRVGLNDEFFPEYSDKFLISFASASANILTSKISIMKI